MKKFVTLLFAAAVMLAPEAKAFDLKTVLGGGSGKTDNVASAIGGLVSGLISSDKISINDLKGTWKYSQPAVSFKSENFLAQAGGAAAAGTIKSKLAPYYKKLGLTNIVVTINEDKTFTMKVNRITLKGTISELEKKGTQANFVFNFSVVGAINIGKMDTYITKTGSNQMSIMFDVTKLISLIQKVGSVTGNSTINSVSSLLSNYDGVCAGFELKK